MEQSAIQMNLLRAGSLFQMNGGSLFDENMTDIFNKIHTQAQAGGKLICMECTGNVVSQGMNYGQSPCEYILNR